jgi:1,4-alpha-glucan branching enzyme
MLKKKYIKSRRVSKVTFEVQKSELPAAIKPASIHVVGDFNAWDPTATPMMRGKRGIFKVAIELEPGQAYQFRYLVNGKDWFNEWHADAYVPNGLGEDNCVVTTPGGDRS